MQSQARRVRACDALGCVFFRSFYLFLTLLVAVFFFAGIYLYMKCIWIGISSNTMTERFFCATQFKASLNVVCIASVRIERVFCILYFTFRFLSLHVLYVMWHLASLYFSFFIRSFDLTFLRYYPTNVARLRKYNRPSQQRIHWHYISLSRKTIMQDMWFHYMQTVDKLQIFIASLCNSFFLRWNSPICLRLVYV